MSIGFLYMLFHTIGENIKKVKMQKVGLESYQAATKFHFLVFNNN